LDAGAHFGLLVGLDGSLFDPFADVDGQSFASRAPAYRSLEIDDNGSAPGLGGFASGPQVRDSGTNGPGGGITIFDLGLAGGAVGAFFNSAFFADRDTSDSGRIGAGVLATYRAGALNPKGAVWGELAGDERLI